MKKNELTEYKVESTECNDIIRNDAMLNNSDLENIDRALYQKKEEELMARSIVTLKTDDPEGAETITYDITLRKGAAKIFGYGHADDIPLMDADVERHTQKVYGIVSGFTIDVQEKRAAKMAHRPVDTVKAIAARRAIAEKENEIFFFGNKTYKIQGLLNFDGIQTMVAALNSNESSSKWKDKTGEEIIEDIRVARRNINLIPGMKADTLLVPPEQYEELDKPVNRHNFRISIRKWLQEQQWFNKILRVSHLENQGENNTDCFVVLDTSPDVIQLAVPMDVIRHSEIMLANMSSQFNVEERTAGPVIRFPFGICRVDGI